MEAVSLPAVSLPGAVVRVSLYGRGAVVTRRVLLPPDLDPAVRLIRVGGISPIAEPGSFRATVIAEGGQATTRRVERIRADQVFPETPPEPPELAGRLFRLGVEVERLEMEARALGARLKQLAGLRPAPRLRQRTAAGDRVGDALAAGAVLERLQREAEARTAELGRQLAALRRERQALELALAQSRASAGQKITRFQAELLLSPAEEGGGRIAALELSCVVRAARWWPAYVLRIQGSRARLQMDAWVAQATEEDWEGAELLLSTGDIHTDLRLPQLAALRYGKAQPPARPNWREPPPGLDRLFEGYDRSLPKLLQEPEAPHLQVDDGLSGMLLGVGRAEGGLQSEAQAQPGRPPGRPPGKGGARQASEKKAQEQAQDRPLSDENERWSSREDIAPRSRVGATLSAAPMPVAFAAPKSGALRGGGMFGAVTEAAAGAAGAVGAAMMGGMMDREKDMEEDSYGQEILPVEPADAWMDYDRLLLGAAEDRGQRGRLHHMGGMGGDAPGLVRREAAAKLERLPVDLVDPLAGRGVFDARYAATARADIPADGQPHRLQVQAGEAATTPQLRVVPRESPEVYRSVRFTNPIAGPLPGGPVEVWVEGSLLCRSMLAPVERGGEVEVGLGVEDRVRCARNVKVLEEKVGLLSGSVSVTHTVHVELRSSLGWPAALEVVDRLPVTDEKHLTITRLSASPEPEPWDQAARNAPIRGGMRWRLTLKPDHPQIIEYQYRLSLSARQEIIGGNRREV